MSTRSDCASAIRSTRAWKRSPRIAISTAPPGTLAKNAVFASTPEARLRTQPPRTPRKMATAAAAISSHQCALTSRPTTGVKSSPSAVPIMICPTARAPGGLRSLAPAKLHAAIARSGPVIQGSGILSQAKAPPTATHSTSARAGFTQLSRAGLTCPWSLADAEPAEDLAEQVVRGEFAGDRAERGVGEAQLLGKDLAAVELAARGVDMAARFFKRAQMALAREKHRLAGGGPTGRREDGGAQLFEALSGLRRDRERALRPLEARREVELVVDQDPFGLRCNRGQRRRRPASLLYHQDEIGLRELAPRALDAEPLELVCRLAQSGGIDQRERHALDLDRLAQRIARRAGDWRDDRALLAGEAVEQARFSDVGAPREHDVNAAAQKASFAALGKDFVESLSYAVQAGRRIHAMHDIHFLLGKIEHRLGERAQLDQPRSE